MTALRFELVIFDCDGTLVDSRANIARVMNMALLEEGLAEAMPVERIGGVVGLSLPEAVRVLLPTADEARRQEVILRYKAHYKRLADAGELRDPLFPGVVEVLERLQHHGVLLAMATGKSMRGVERTLNDHGLGKYFSWLKSADCAPSKPHPGMVEQILAASGISPPRVLMVGDTEYDILMGRHAGVVTCAVTYGCHPPERLARAAPHHWVQQMAELLPLVVTEA